MKDITSEDFPREVLEADEPVLVDFYAPRCSRCRAMERVIADIEAQSGVKVVRIDVDREHTVAKKYAVMSLPTLMIFSGGEQEDKKIGLCSREDIMDMLELI